MKKIILTLTYSIIFTIGVYAQTIATTDDGRKIILNDNGTWELVQTDKTKTTSTYSCSDLISTSTDKMTGKSSTSAKKTLIISKDGGKNGFGFFIMKSAKTVIFSIQAVGAGNCIDDDNKMIVLFRDGTRYELINNGDFNCDAKFTLYLGDVFGKMKQLEKFSTTEVETIRIWTSDSFVEEDFTREQSLELLRTVDCLLNS